MKTRGLLLLLSLLLCLGLALCFVSCEEEAPTPEPPAPEAPEQPEDPEAPEEPGDEEPHEHSFGSWTVIKAATCGAQGRRMRLCACGEREYASDFATEEHLYGIENKCVVCGDVWEYYENLSYELNADGASYTISGFGGEIGEILALPCYYNGLPVTAIADEAFRGVDGLVELHLTDYMTHIGARAFENCATLNLILFEKNTHLGQIGERAFAGTAITAFEIPADVLVIGDGAFAECRALEELTVAEGNSRYAISKSGCLIDLASMTLLRMGAQGVFSTDYTLT
ncbi:MAG: leucine-rich repeat domain-containing protein, partial [Clostridia bacterium]|nr:leucine-rich repeat domain-containing protein [Clostridia bacterium]